MSDTVTRERVFLIGYRGTGKSTVARLLAEQLGWSWCDADAELEQRWNTTIRRMFAEEGEAAFRDKEAALLEDLCRRQRCVIATGGGIVLRPENRERLRHGAVVWLKAPADVIWRRLQEDAQTAERRPDLAQGGFDEVQALLAARQPLYEACADWNVDASDQTPADVARKIAAWLQT